jgi:hypothetical protein
MDYEEMNLLRSQIDDIDESRRIITLTDDVSSLHSQTQTHPKLRRWDGASGATPVTTGVATPLELGIEITFSGSNFKVGDYWVFYARTGTGEVEVLNDAPQRNLNDHHYCRLAVVNWDAATGQAQVSDCRPEFPALTQLTNLLYVSGDGQEVMPNLTLPTALLEYPLQVRVANGGCPVAGARVRFQILDGTGGSLTGIGNSVVTPAGVVVTTGVDGIASCSWALEVNVANPRQQVEVTLLGADGNPIRDNSGNLLQVVRFNAHLSIASEVSYDSSNCINPNNPTTVQDALDQLCRNIALYYVSGDGQEALPGALLPKPLQARVANQQWPVTTARVRFRISDGNGTLNASTGFTTTPASGNALTVTTNAEGLVQCEWRLDNSTWSQQVTAELLDNAGNPIHALRFNANLSIASQVGYTPPIDCEELQGMTNVQEAIDALCRIERAGCCTVVVRRPEEIQPAIDSLTNGGRVCILPGDYRLRDTIKIVGIAHENEVIISGCDCRTHIIAPGGNPAFEIENSDQIKLESLGIKAESSKGAIFVTKGKRVTITDCCINNSGGFGISAQGEVVRMTNNQLRGGGIWVHDGSSQVTIKDNDIGNGGGPGVGLGGGVPVDNATGILRVEIVGNEISQMSNSGITTLAESGDSGEIEDVTIRENQILDCALRGPDARFDAEAVGGIVLREASHVRMYHNDIRGNGMEKQVPACGIFTFACQGLDVADNHILNNGSSTVAPRPIPPINFGLMTSDSNLDTLAGEGVFVESRDSNDNFVASEFVTAPSGVSGLRLNARTHLVFAENPTVVRVNVANRPASAALRAFDENDNEISVAAPRTPSDGTEEFTIFGPVNRISVDMGVTATPANNAVISTLSAEKDRSYQAGILALFATEAPLSQGSANAFGTKVSAVRIHHNIVDCPQGHALFVVGMGEIAVTDNTLSSQAVTGELPPVAPLTAFGELPELAESSSGVFLLNLGRNAELADGMPAFGFNTNINSGTPATAGLRTPSSVRPIRFPDGRVLFQDNQVTHQVTGKPFQQFRAALTRTGRRFGVASFLLDAENNLRFEVNMTTFSGAVTSATINADGAVFLDITDAFRGTVRVGSRPPVSGRRELTDERAERFRTGQLRLNMTTSIGDISGQIQLLPPRTLTPLIGGSIGLISLDDISFQGNQVRTSVRTGVVFANVAVLAPSIRANGNRFTEWPNYSAQLSYFSWAVMNMTTSNQATHCIYTGGGTWTEQNNQEQLNANCGLLDTPLRVLIRS